MPALEGGAALPVTTGGEGPTDGRKAAVPVYVVTDGPAIGQRARRVVVVTDGPVEGGAAIPVYDAGVDALYSSEAAIPVFVVSGSLGSATPTGPGIIVNEGSSSMRGSGDPITGETIAKYELEWMGWSQGVEVTVSNVAVLGDTVLDMIADAATEVDPSYDSAAAFNIAIIWGGFNDINGTITAQDLYDRLEDWVDGRAAVGFTTVILDLSSRTNWAAGGDTVRLATNALLLASPPSDYLVVQPGSDPRYGPTAADRTSLLWWAADGDHVNRYAYQRIAERGVVPVLRLIANDPLPVVPSKPAEIDTSLRAYWPFDGDVVDSVNAYAMTVVGTILQPWGHIEHCLFLDAGADYCTLPSTDGVLCLNATKTIVVWVMCDVTTGADRAVLSRWEGASEREYLLDFFRSSNKYRLLYSVNGAATLTLTFGPAAFVIQRWNMLTIQYNSSTRRLRARANLEAWAEATVASPGIGHYSANPTYVGTRNNDATVPERLSGTIEGIAEFNGVELSEDSITWLYNNHLGQAASDLITENRLLLETGDQLLLEDGDYLLLES